MIARRHSKFGSAFCFLPCYSDLALYSGTIVRIYKYIYVYIFFFIYVAVYKEKTRQRITRFRWLSSMVAGTIESPSFLTRFLCNLWVLSLSLSPTTAPCSPTLLLVVSRVESDEVYEKRIDAEVWKNVKKNSHFSSARFFFAFLFPAAFLCSPPAVPGEVQVTLAKSKVSSSSAHPNGPRHGIDAAFVVSKNKRTRLRRALLGETWSEWVTRLVPRRTRNGGIPPAEWAGHVCWIPKTRCDRTWMTVKWVGERRFSAEPICQVYVYIQTSCVL